MLLDLVEPPALAQLVNSLLALCKEHYSSSKAAEQLAPKYKNFRRPIDPAVGEPICAGSRLTDSTSQPITALLHPPIGKPVLNDHVNILGILRSSFTLLWANKKFKDQLALYQARITKFGTPAPQRHVSGRGGPSAAGSSKTRSKRKDKTEDLDVQIKPKKAKRSQSERPPDNSKGKGGKKPAEEDSYLG